MAQRDHALSMASAKHLMSQGHMKKAEHDRICKDCEQKMKRREKPAPRRAAPASMPMFGSLGAGHPMRTTSGEY
jgi:hypothetical protein